VFATVAPYNDNPGAFVLPTDRNGGWSSKGRAGSYHDRVNMGGACSEENGANPCWYRNDGLGGAHCQGWSVFYAPGLWPCIPRNPILADGSDMKYTMDDWKINNVRNVTGNFNPRGGMPDGGPLGMDGLLLTTNWKEIENGVDGVRILRKGVWRSTAANVNGEARMFHLKRASYGWPPNYPDVLFNQQGWRELVLWERGRHWMQ
jgi:hypothetical protein